MHIATYCHNYLPHPGGVEGVVNALGHEALRFGHRVTVTTTAWGGRRGRACEDGLEVLRLPAIHTTERLGVPYPIPLGPGVRQAWRTAAPATVHHAHGCLYATTLLAATAARRASRPLIVTEHVGIVPYPSRTLMRIQAAAWRLVGERVLRCADAVVACNARVRDWLSGRTPTDKVYLVPNGVDVDRFRPADQVEREQARSKLGLPRAGTLAIFVGRDTPKKNLDAIIQMPRTGFRVVACGVARELPSDFHNLGVLPFALMPLAYRAADFLIHAGVGEGFPMAVQEAAASGLPLVVLWDAGYAAALARDDALTVDFVGELAQACARLAASPALRNEYGQRSRRRAETSWSWSRATHAYLQIYASTSAAKAKFNAERRRSDTRRTA